MLPYTLNGTICFLYTSLFNQTNDKNISSYDDFNSKNGDHVTFAPTDSMIHNFLDV
jgi:hypothetical protein